MEEFSRFENKGSKKYFEEFYSYLKEISKIQFLSFSFVILAVVLFWFFNSISLAEAIINSLIVFVVWTLLNNRTKHTIILQSYCVAKDEALEKAISELKK